MADLDALKDSMTSILKESIEGMKPDSLDRENLLTYGKEIVALVVKAKMAAGPEKVALLEEMQGYEDAISMVIARYEVRAGSTAEKALLRVLAGATKFAIAALA